MLLPPQYRGSVIAQEKIASDFLIGNLTQEPWYTREVFAGKLERLQTTASVLAGLRFHAEALWCRPARQLCGLAWAVVLSVQRSLALGCATDGRRVRYTQTCLSACEFVLVFWLFFALRRELPRQNRTLATEAPLRFDSFAGFRGTTGSYIHYRADGSMEPVAIDAVGIGEYDAAAGPIEAENFFKLEQVGA